MGLKVSATDMKNIKIICITFAYLSVMISCNSKQDEAADSTSTITKVFASGDDKVVIFEREGDKEGVFSNSWEWTAAESDGLPQDFVKYFRTNDECKPIGDDKILITSSSGGVALVDIKTKNTLFYAHAPNAHSAEYLPNDRIAVALSTAEKGNALQLFDRDRPNEILFSDSLYSGHGVVWVPEKESLFALGYADLREYKLSDWDTPTPSLVKVNEWTIPDESGHDLFLTSDQRLLLSTTNSVWEFDIAQSEFSEFEPLKGVTHVKSVNLNSDTGELVYTKGEISWWTHNVYFENPQDTLIVEDIKLYKVRVR
jgi:hypothetical protein